MSQCHYTFAHVLEASSEQNNNSKIDVREQQIFFFDYKPKALLQFSEVEVLGAKISRRALKKKREKELRMEERRKIGYNDKYPLHVFGKKEVVLGWWFRLFPVCVKAILSSSSSSSFILGLAKVAHTHSHSSNPSAFVVCRGSRERSENMKNHIELIQLLLPDAWNTPPWNIIGRC